MLHQDEEWIGEGEARGKTQGSKGAKPMAKGNLEGGWDGFSNTSLEQQDRIDQSSPLGKDFWIHSLEQQDTIDQSSP